MSLLNGKVIDQQRPFEKLNITSVERQLQYKYGQNIPIAEMINPLE